MIKRALISVWDKTNVVEFAKELNNMGIEILSTGGTMKAISDAGIPVTSVSEITGFPECLDGRVKTLHPKVHAGILAMRDNQEHMKQLENLDIDTIDLVAINLYPFKQTISKENVTFEDAIENIDIGGPTMLRAAAKNHQDVTVIVDCNDYDQIIDELKNNQKVSEKTNLKLAWKVFEHTSHYDTLIAGYLRNEIGESNHDTYTMTFEKQQELRYGENPHQKAVFYKESLDTNGCLTNAKQLHGKELSYNNINDTNGALELIKEFRENPSVVAVKHANPCGVGVAETLYQAYLKAYEADPVSIFGGIIAANREIDQQTAEQINQLFIEIVVAPSFSKEALQILTKKKNIRLLELPDILEPIPSKMTDMKRVAGGMLLQDYNRSLVDEDQMQVVTKTKPSKELEQELLFAMRVCKHTKSNAIVLSKDHQTIGIGPGQVSRVGALEIALNQAKEKATDGVMASDAFFPFPDCVEMAAKAGIKAIIQPGGSKNDQSSIDECDKHGMVMIVTGIRHFRH